MRMAYSGDLASGRTRGTDSSYSRLTTLEPTGGMTKSRPYRPRVMLVDDHPQVLRGLSRLLGPSCDIVAGVAGGEEAVETAARLMPDVLIVDLTMADMDGLEVCRRVKQSAPETDVILVTAFDDKQVAVAAFEAGASEFLAKHDAAAALESVILRLVEKKRSGS
jgi:CheY-like chemotaxis protein